jgi:hypothetical protein
MYKTVIEFADLQDHEHIYRVGDEFPRRGFSVSKERIHELASSANRRNVALIEKVEDKPETPEPTEIEQESEQPEVHKRGRKKKTV